MELYSEIVYNFYKAYIYYKRKLKIRWKIGFIPVVPFYMFKDDFGGFSGERAERTAEQSRMVLPNMLTVQYILLRK